MIDLKQRLQINNIFFVALLFLATQARADVAAGGDYTLTKVLIGASGSGDQIGSDYEGASAFGEQASGQSCADDNAIDTVDSGYFGGHSSSGKSFTLLSASIDGPLLTQDGVRVGVPLNASIHLSFSEPVNTGTLYDGLSAQVVTDHLGQSQSTLAPIQFSADITGSTITISPQGAWDGNTVYNLLATAGLQGADGATLAPTPSIPFLTLLNPTDDNLVLMPVGGSGAASVIALNGPPPPPINIHIAPQALSDYAVLLVNRDPLTTPLNVSPDIIRTANSRALATYGNYATPLGLTQITAYNAQGVPLTTLEQPAQVSMAVNLAQGTPSYIRPGTLALWALDTDHQIWVKVPSSQLSQGILTASIAKFSVFTLMAEAAGSASDTYVFPNPWRPHGPNAGTGVGQTGTDTGGMTFTNLPSECAVKIYTISGELVRSLHHSDTIAPTLGEETWDGRTTHGETAASGVYLWRVESSVDGKNGKLIIIR